MNLSSRSAVAAPDCTPHDAWAGHEQETDSVVIDDEAKKGGSFKQ